MELVIKIPEKTYNQLVDVAKRDKRALNYFGQRVTEGVPLPKGHGRLIDADRLKEEMEKDVRRAMSFVDLTDFVWLAPTVIEADKEGEEE